MSIGQALHDRGINHFGRDRWTISRSEAEGTKRLMSTNRRVGDAAQLEAAATTLAADP